MDILIFTCAFLLGGAAGLLIAALRCLRRGAGGLLWAPRDDALDAQYRAMLAYDARANGGPGRED